jgi:hypothetical protein
MRSTTLKKQMHNAIDRINDDDFLAAINTILQQKSSEYSYELSSEEKKELMKRRKGHFSGTSKDITLNLIKENAVARYKK